MPRQVPVIDLADSRGDRRAEIAKQLTAAASDTGFFQVVNHQIPEDVVSEAFKTGQSFFALPNEVKQKSHFQHEVYMGWRGLEEIEESTGVPGAWEAFQVGFDSPMSQRNLWPTEDRCPGFRERALQWMQQCDRVAQLIVSYLAEGLGLPTDFFTKHMNVEGEECCSASNWMHYPDVSHRKVPDGQMRLHAHADGGSLVTLLFQIPGQPGLEICPGKEAETDNPQDKIGSWAPRTFGTNDWTRIDPLAGAITVNIGDQLMRFSDGSLASTYHRVRQPDPDEFKGTRYAIAYFASVQRSTVIAGPEGKYPAVTAGDLISAEGAQYETVRDDKTWQESAYQAAKETGPAAASPAIAAH